MISFFVKENSFVYETQLKKGNKNLDDIDNGKVIIAQNIVPIYSKLNIFIEALKENNEFNNKMYSYIDKI